MRWSLYVFVCSHLSTYFFKPTEKDTTDTWLSCRAPVPSIDASWPPRFAECTLFTAVVIAVVCSAFLGREAWVKSHVTKSGKMFLR